MKPENLARFQRDVATMLLVFVTVALVDLTVVALVMGKVRFWWPTWLDPNWATDPNTRVIYSQSYFAGILFVPYAFYLAQRDLLAHWSQGRKAGLWALAAAVLAFLVWWKGSLTLEFHKGRELAAWALLTAVLFGAVKLAQAAPRLTGGGFLRVVLSVGGVVFTVMTLLDPVIQLGVHHLAWSSGLTIELFAYGAGAVASFVALKKFGPVLQA
jgi:hypothetical protein